MTHFAKTLASPNTPVSGYFGAVRHLVRVARDTEWDSDRKALIALTIMMAVATVETFFNVWFRTFAQREPFAKHRDQLVADLNARIGIRQKVKEWPKLFFGRSMDFSPGVGQRFLQLVDKRNQLMHVTTSCETATLPGVTIHDLVDVTDYEALTLADAESAMRLAEEFLAAFFRFKGDTHEHVLHQLHLWLGRVPLDEEREHARALDGQNSGAA